MEENDVRKFLKAALEVVVRNQGADNEFLNCIVTKLKENDCAEQLFNLAMHHLNVFKSFFLINENMNKHEVGFDEKKINSFDCVSKFLISYLFLSNIKTYPYGQKSHFHTEHAEAIESLPIETFLTVTEIERQKFEKELVKFDILYAEVENSSALNEHIQLKVIAKDNDIFTFVYHLNVKVYMFKSQELERLQLSPTEISEKILKVSVIGKARKGGTKFICVTTNSNFLQNNGIMTQIDLGIISPEVFPIKLNLVKAAQRFPTYTHFLRSHANFYQLHHSRKDLEAAGLQKNSTKYNFGPDYSIKSLETKSKLDLHYDSKKHCDEACKLIEDKDIPGALQAFDEALKCWPENPKVYEKRGMMYASLMDTKIGSNLKKACLDFDSALKYNPGAQEVKANYAKIFVTLASREMKLKKNLSLAKKYLHIALSINKNEDQAIKLSERLEKKIEKESRTLLALEKRKELIQRQLIKTECV